MEKEIKKICRKNKIKFPIDCNGDIETITYELEGESIIDFTVHYRESSAGSDSWLQAEYYSNTIQKTLIWDYDYPYEFETIDELVSTLEQTQREVEEFESRIIIKK